MQKNNVQIVKEFKIILNIKMNWMNILRIDYFNNKNN